MNKTIISGGSIKHGYDGNSIIIEKKHISDKSFRMHLYLEEIMKDFVCICVT